MFAAIQKASAHPSPHILSQKWQSLAEPVHPFWPVEPEVALSLNFSQLTTLLEKRIGRQTTLKLLQGKTIPSPMTNEKNGDWLQTSKIIGVNPRSLNSYLDIVKYALTFPEEAIHLLPFWEPGTANSLYAPINWQANPEFISPELSKIGFDTSEKQLKFVVNALHALGKVVGMDIEPHTDRFSETVFQHPEFFEWIRLNADKTAQVDNADTLYQEVQQTILNFLESYGDAQGNPVSETFMKQFFSSNTSEAVRQHILFGDSKSPQERLKRRLQLMNYVREQGFETLPVSFILPYRPIRYIGLAHDQSGNSWADFDAPENPEAPYPFRVFGSITPYKWFKSENGIPETHHPLAATWNYFADKIADVQRTYGFDFLRADMAHIQYKPGGLSQEVRYYPHLENGIWAHVKKRVQSNAPHFATFAEIFLQKDGHGYGDPYKNTQAQHFDAALGDLQYQKVDPNFLEKVKRSNLAGLFRHVGFKVSQTLFTTDSDKQKFNFLYDSPLANQVRAFLGFFLNQPSYMGMGFETRENMPPDDNCFYTRHYIDGDTKPTQGAYRWGHNSPFFQTLTQMRKMYAQLKQELKEKSHYWLNVLNEGSNTVGAWVYFDPVKGASSLFVINTDIQNSKPMVEIENPAWVLPFSSEEKRQQNALLTPIYSTAVNPQKLAVVAQYQNHPIRITNLLPGEARIYRIRNRTPKTSQ